MSEQELYNAYYSEKMAAELGTVIYEREDGSTVEVTSVARVGTDHGLRWDDLEDRGIVVRFVRKGRPNPNPSRFTLLDPMSL